MGDATIASNAELRQQVFARDKHPKKSKSTPKLSVFAAYAGVFVLIVSIISIGYRQPQSIEAASVQTTAGAPATVNIDKPSVDEVVATDVAANLAEQTDMWVAKNVANLSVSLSAKSELAQTSEAAISKPQIIQPTAASREITTYKSKAGDTVQSVASANSLTADTIRWANNLASDAIDPNKDIVIPPVDGVVYTTRAGDTPDSIAATYKADRDRIVAFNDLEIGGISAGKRIVIPGGIMPENLRPGYESPAAVSARNSGLAGSGGSGFRINSSIARASAGNAYAFGNCTWYAYERRAQLGRPVGSFWGNAATWAMYARAAGYRVDNKPEVGAVMQNGGGYGHVAIVEGVAPNGDVRVSEMNYYGGGGGFNIVSGRTISAGQARSYNYIH